MNDIMSGAMTHRPALQKIFAAIGCVAAGWVAAFAMSPHSFWPAMFAGVCALYFFYSKALTAMQAFSAGFFFALGYFVTGLWWIGNALLVEGNEFAWVWPISVVGLPTLLALFTGTYLAIARISGDPKTLRGFFCFVFFLTFSEWARGHAFSGFPWNLYGYVWGDHLEMAQAAHYIGAYGLTFVTLAWAGAAEFARAATLSPKLKIILMATVAATMTATYFGGASRLENNPTGFDKDNALVVVQPNIAQNMKWDPVAIQDNFRKTISLSMGATFETPPKNIFILWPETAISPAVYNLEENMDRMRALLSHYPQSNAYLVTGILRRTEKTPGDVNYANSVIFLDRALSVLNVYDKSHLVPFGEFIPLQRWIPLKPVAAFKGFKHGEGAMTMTPPNAPPFSPLICYEVIFPDDVVAKTGPRPRWIVNVTNDGWYGDSAGPHQHFAQTRLRAIEEGIPVARAANTGISGIIDPYGRVLEQADIFQEAALVGYLPAALPEKNIYWPWLIQIFLPIIALSLMIRRAALSHT